MTDTITPFCRVCFAVKKKSVVDRVKSLSMLRVDTRHCSLGLNDNSSGLPGVSSANICRASFV